MADLYFIPTISTDPESNYTFDWNEAGNWFLNSSGTIPANRIPNNGDSVILDGSLIGEIYFINTGNRNISLTNLSLNGIGLYGTSISDALTISNLFTVTDSSYALDALGNITTNQFIINNLGGSGGNITGNGYVTGSSNFEGLTINGDLYIDGMTSVLQFTVNGNIIFKDINPSLVSLLGVTTQDIPLTYSATGGNKIITVNNASRLSIYNVPLIGMRVVGSGIPLGAKISIIDGNNITLDCNSNIPATNNESVTFKGTIIFDNCSYTSNSNDVSITGNTILINDSNLNGSFNGLIDVYDTSSLAGGDVGLGNNSTINFYDYSTLVGDAYLGPSNSRINFYNNSVNGATYIFGSNGGDLYFYDNSYNNGYTINYIKSVSFNDNSYNITFITSGSLNFNGFTGTNVDGTFIGGSRVYYFSGDTDSEWSNTDNWFYFYDGETFSEQANELPDTDFNISSIVYIYADITYGDGNPTVYNLTFNGQWMSLNIGIINEAIVNGFIGDISNNAYFVVGDVTINGNNNNAYGCGLNNNCTIQGFVEFNLTEGIGVWNRGSIDGDAVFKNGSVNEGEVQNNAQFYNSSFNCKPGCASSDAIGTVIGVINGNAEFYDSSYNMGSVVGNAIFNHNSYNYFGGDVNYAIFNDYSYNDENVNFDAIFNGYSYNQYQVLGTATFNDYSYQGALVGYAIFNDYSHNESAVNVDAIFNHNSYNSDSDTFIGGDATFNDASYTMTTPNEISIGTLVLGTRTPYPIRTGINNSNILGLI